MSTGLTVRDLAGRVGGTVYGDEAVVCTDVRHDSREVGPGDLFVAVVGFSGDGHDYLPAAAASGASAVCVERRGDVAVPQIVVDSARGALGPLAAGVHGDPSRVLPVVGVTGTNGKTTVTHMITSIVEAAGMVPGLVGTVGARIGGETRPQARTTPEASDLQRLLASMVRSGVEAASIEVSSHALELGRVDGTWFSVVAFTNLSQDHLDFHGDMESYYAVKRRLFDGRRSDHGIVSIADRWGRRLVSEIDIPLTTTGIDDGDVTVTDLRTDLDGSRFLLVIEGSQVPVTLELPGRFNVENALVAAACARSLDVPLDVIAAGLSGPLSIPGRFEKVAIEAPFHVIIDYAHTPEAIERIVWDVRASAAGRVIVVVGAGGERDHAKRPEMGKAASLADLAIVTSDNPRSEDPEAIIEAVMAGAGDTAVAITDRRAAIEHALDAATEGDVILVLGKGHETTQDMGGAFVPFDDRETVTALVAEASHG